MKKSNKSAGRMMSKFFTWMFLPAATILNFTFYYTATHGTAGDNAFDNISSSLDNLLSLSAGFLCLAVMIYRMKEDLTS
ncbi:hypothetical protein OMR58_22420 [Erwinia sp. INIA-01]|uniref:hypothetical protein n=1 Tax=Erwinia sp. INIA01 TaxID=2991500 RepID=UPI0022252486|nr:hypothetical protein [Erwinia sp. INIA01]MCW1877207.1 hypothetical protein [Erwinia sp. INIA01]